MKAKISTLILTLLLFTAVTAHALVPNYDSTFTPKSPMTFVAGDLLQLSFAPSQDSFTSAYLDLYLSNVTASSVKVRGHILTSPARGQIYNTNDDYLFATDLLQGKRPSLDLNPYLSSLSLGKRSGNIDLGLYITQGSGTFNSAKLTGTVAPEPATMALVAAGLFGLPFARRFRDYLR